MTDAEDQVEVQKASNSHSGENEFAAPQDQSSDMEPDTVQVPSVQHRGRTELEGPLLLLADVALAPSGGSEPACSKIPCCSLQKLQAERYLQSMQLQLLFLVSKADHLQDSLISCHTLIERKDLAGAVPNFLYTCQPYFNHLETIARSTVLPLLLSIVCVCVCVCARYVQLLDLSQQLCDRLQQLVLTFASHSLLCLDETEPSSLSHFCIGQTQLGHLRLSTFLYCRPTPYQASVDTGVYKRMRWNVERLRDEQQQGGEAEEEEEEEEEETARDTEYYFLCCEDIPMTDEEKDGEDGCLSNKMRMWSIGQWVQVNPDPNTEDIYDWILCRVPEGSYRKLLLLGSEEPTSCTATDLLLLLLLSQQEAESETSLCGMHERSAQFTLESAAASV
ncbi:uncharacterized protein V6R79_015167 [Siganus canaliculatus]